MVKGRTLTPVNAMMVSSDEHLRTLCRAQAEMYRCPWWRWWWQRRELRPEWAASLVRYVLMKAQIEHRMLMSLTRDAHMEMIWLRMGRYMLFSQLADWLIRRARRYRSRRRLLEAFLSASVSYNALGLSTALEASEAVVLRFLYGWVFRRMDRLPRWTVRWSRRRLLLHLGRRSAGTELMDDVRKAMEDIHRPADARRGAAVG